MTHRLYSKTRSVLHWLETAWEDRTLLIVKTLIILISVFVLYKVYGDNSEGWMLAHPLKISCVSAYNLSRDIEIVIFIKTDGPR
ncbi:Hypothetical protein LUCI_1458 [Lucifera butyrica]|uniref:Uncharacterized protein n=1 Tax=Lucifera butyrica TaxID=1351585 RepID=A0A498R7J8_9FIRM|nr:Hypothetical protein LUCI_1458 [Lucifera butyrica]